MPACLRARTVVLLLGCLAFQGRSALAQLQVERFAASDGAGSDDFGKAVALHHDRALVGAWFDDDDGYGSGSAYVWERAQGSWSEVQKLTASDANTGDRFGNAVALENDRAVVGAYLNSISPWSDSGAVYVFERNGGGAWLQQVRLTPEDPQEDAHFGVSLDLSGQRILVGADRDEEGGQHAGAAYVFGKQSGSWVQEAKLMASDTMPDQFFGAQVRLSGTRALIGAPAYALPSLNSGAAYVFEESGSGWTERARLLPSDPEPEAQFGAALALSGDTLAIGAPYHDRIGHNAGVVYVFERHPTGWIETAQLFPADGHPDQRFGTDLALIDDLLVVGSPLAEAEALYTGAAYVYRRTQIGWMLLGRVTSGDGSMHDFVGEALALSPSGEVLLGTPGDDDAGNHTGSAYLFQIPDGVRAFGFCDLGPCGNGDPTAGCLSVGTQGARLVAGGTTQASQDDLVLEALDLPPGQPCVFVRGDGRSTQPFGSGRLLVTSAALGFVRYPVQSSSPAGAARIGPGLVADSAGQGPAIVAGQTWLFQALYLGPAGPCGALNGTQGLAVTFTP